MSKRSIAASCFRYTQIQLKLWANWRVRYDDFPRPAETLQRGPVWDAIRMYFDDRNPPHFHAIYAGNEAQMAIDSIEILEGELPARAASMVFEWAWLHQRELLRNWHRLHNEQPAEGIRPLEGTLRLRHFHVAHPKSEST